MRSTVTREDLDAQRKYFFALPNEATMAECAESIVALLNGCGELLSRQAEIAADTRRMDYLDAHPCVAESLLKGAHMRILVTRRLIDSAMGVPVAMREIAFDGSRRGFYPPGETHAEASDKRVLEERARNRQS